MGIGRNADDGQREVNGWAGWLGCFGVCAFFNGS